MVYFVFSNIANFDNEVFLLLGKSISFSRDKFNWFSIVFGFLFILGAFSAQPISPETAIDEEQATRKSHFSATGLTTAQAVFPMLVDPRVLGRAGAASPSR